MAILEFLIFFYFPRSTRITVLPSCLEKVLVVYNNKVLIIVCMNMAARLNNSPTWYPGKRFLLQLCVLLAERTVLRLSEDF